MSIKLLEFASAFVSGKITADEFADDYIEKFYAERDAGLLKKDERSLSSALSTTFIVADLYSPDADRKEYEFDETQLRKEVAKVLATVKK